MYVLQFCRPTCYIFMISELLYISRILAAVWSAASCKIIQSRKFFGGFSACRKLFGSVASGGGLGYNSAISIFRRPESLAYIYK